MSEEGWDPRVTRRILWLGALLLLPLPMLRFEALVPVARFVLLTGVTTGLIVTEGLGRIPILFFVLMAGHALVYTGLLYGAAWLLAKGLHAAAPRAAGRVALALVVGLAVVALSREIYVTPFAPVSPRANLLGVLR